MERKERHRVEDKLAKLTARVEARHQLVARSKRSSPENGLINLQEWVRRHKLQSFVQLRLEERLLMIEIDEAAQSEALLLAGCYAIETDVPPGRLGSPGRA